MDEHRRPVGVKVGQHAKERFLERFPHCREEQVAGTIFREVQQGLVEGRYSSKLPRWVELAARNNGRRLSQRFVWNEEKTRCYPLMRDHDRDHDRVGEFGLRWIVKTTLRAMSDEEIAEQQRLLSLNRENRGSRNGIRRHGGGSLFGSDRRARR